MVNEMRSIYLENANENLQQLSQGTTEEFFSPLNEDEPTTLDESAVGLQLVSENPDSRIFEISFFPLPCALFAKKENVGPKNVTESSRKVDSMLLDNVCQKKQGFLSQRTNSNHFFSLNSYSKSFSYKSFSSMHINRNRKASYNLLKEVNRMEKLSEHGSRDASCVLSSENLPVPCAETSLFCDKWKSIESSGKERSFKDKHSQDDYSELCTAPNDLSSKNSKRSHEVAETSISKRTRSISFSIETAEKTKKLVAKRTRRRFSSKENRSKSKKVFEENSFLPTKFSTQINLIDFDDLSSDSGVSIVDFKEAPANSLDTCIDIESIPSHHEKVPFPNQHEVVRNDTRLRLLNLGEDGNASPSDSSNGLANAAVEESQILISKMNKGYTGYDDSSKQITPHSFPLSPSANVLTKPSLVDDAIKGVEESIEVVLLIIIDEPEYFPDTLLEAGKASPCLNEQVSPFLNANFPSTFFSTQGDEVSMSRQSESFLSFWNKPCLTSPLTFPLSAGTSAVTFQPSPTSGRTSLSPLRSETDWSSQLLLSPRKSLPTSTVADTPTQGVLISQNITLQSHRRSCGAPLVREIRSSYRNHAVNEDSLGLGVIQSLLPPETALPATTQSPLDGPSCKSPLPADSWFSPMKNSFKEKIFVDEDNPRKSVQFVADKNIEKAVFMLGMIHPPLLNTLKDLRFIIDLEIQQWASSKDEFSLPGIHGWHEKWKSKGYSYNMSKDGLQTVSPDEETVTYVFNLPFVNSFPLIGSSPVNTLPGRYFLYLFATE